MGLNKTGKNVAVNSLLVMSLISINAHAAPKVIFKDIYNKHQAFNAAPMPQAIRGVIKNLEAKKPDLYQVVVYKMKDHYLLYQLSGKEWSANQLRVDLDANGEVKDIVTADDGDREELKTYSDAQGEPKCPDETVQFVAISAYPGIGGVDKSIATVSAAAKQKYKTVTILGDKADGKTYKNWLSCPNLKGFYSIGHGSPDAIMVGNGDVIDYTFFANPQLVNKFKSTTVIFNTCQVYNFPFGTEIMYGNVETATEYATNPGPNAYEFMGGHTNLMMVTSELSSACFMAQAIMGAKMDYDTLKLCIGKQDLHYQNFGLSQPGRYFDTTRLLVNKNVS